MVKIFILLVVLKTGKRLQHNHNNRHEIDLFCSENLASNKSR